MCATQAGGGRDPEAGAPCSGLNRRWQPDGPQHEAKTAAPKWQGGSGEPRWRTGTAELPNRWIPAKEIAMSAYDEYADSVTDLVKLPRHSEPCQESPRHLRHFA